MSSPRWSANLKPPARLTGIGSPNLAASRAFAALELLAFHTATASQIGATLGIHQRTARRLLETLVHEQYLDVVDSRPAVRYRASMRTVALAAQILDRSPLVRTAAGIASELHQDTGVPVSIATPSYRSVLYVLRYGSRDASPWPHVCDLHSAEKTAAGRALLAHRPHWRDSVLESLDRPSKLLEELATIRSTGIARDTVSTRADVRAIAVPVVNRDGEAIAALELGSPARVAPNAPGRPAPLAAFMPLAERARAAATAIAECIAKQPS